MILNRVAIISEMAKQHITILELSVTVQFQCPQLEPLVVAVVLQRTVLDVLLLL